MKIAICKGGCVLRFTCKNINKKVCKPVPKDNKKYIECNHFERRD